MAEEIEVAISCLCGAHKHTYSIPSSVQDLEYFICHCNSCRKSSGASLYQGAVVWPYTLKSVSETDKVPTDPKPFLRQYDYGPSLDFWYCETCSTKMYWQYKAPGSELELFPGLIPDDLLIPRRLRMSCLLQVHVGDTLDEGLSRCFHDSAGAVGPRRQNGSKSDIYEVQHDHPVANTPEEPIQGICHCGQTTLKLERRRYKVELDTSDSSRALNSTAVSAWALVEAQDILELNNLPVEAVKQLGAEQPFNEIGSLSTYTFSDGEDVVYFCKGCSAKVLLQRPARNEGAQLRIGPGLLDSASGARKEDILDWDDVNPIEIQHRNITVNPKEFRTLI